MTDTSATPRLALRPREAAAALGISERLLWSMTSPRGELRCIRLGRAVRYAVADLERFIDQHKGGDRRD